MTTHPTTRHAHASKPARLALSLTDAGSSGIIDIQDLRAEPLPLSLSEALSRRSTAAPPRPHPSPPRGRRWLAVGSASTLCLGILGLLLMLAPAADTVLQHTDRDRGLLSMHEAAVDPGELAVVAEPPKSPATTRSRAPEGDRASEAEPAAPSEHAEAAVPIAAQAMPAPAVEPKAKPRARSRAAAPSPGSPPKATSKAEERTIAVECVLDPSRCDARGSAASTPTKPASSRPAPLPAKLSMSQLKQALATTKADARRCGPEHGVDPGTTVRVKLSIEGTTGEVLSATPQGEHATGSLGRCVARALGQARFPRFASDRMGTLYSVRL